ncbi:MAG: prolipoprotein diacylglyceryl transferase [Xanthomonadales bacterium]|nr:prolipoprotein diacylglyceryl transferase [Xanthomonadales bacterium]
MASDLPYFVNFDPVALSLGPIDIHWYGIMYLLGFGTFWYLANLRARSRQGWNSEQVSDLLFYGAIGVILGGRIGYILFYDLPHVLDDPLRVLKIWQGGMSFHGGLLGVIAAMFYFARKTDRRFFEVADFVAPLAPPGLFFGRLGNFIGGELWGRTTDAPWGMIFPKSIDFQNWDSAALYQQYQAGLLNEHARHPSQLYEAGLEGLLLFIILMWYSRRPRPTMAVSGLFLALYGLFRGFVEFFRQPDEHLGFLAADWVTMGMLLSLPMIVAGLGMMAYAYRKNQFAGDQQ